METTGCRLLELIKGGGDMDSLGGYLGDLFGGEARELDVCNRGGCRIFGICH
jgi:hypothetical protein